MINKTILCVDGGLFSSWSERMSREYERVLYFRPWTRSFSHPNDYFIGQGYDNFEKVEHFWRHVDEADTVAFFDIHFPDWADHLRSMGKPVWSAFYGENLELNRYETKVVLEQVGLPVGDYEVVEGMDELRAYLQENENQFVKIPKLRGLTETFHCIDYELSKIKLDDIEHKLGMAAEVQQFIIEAAIDAKVESGYDGWCIDGQFPKTSVVGCEIKDMASASMVRPYNLLPKEVRETNQKLSPILRGYGYKCFFSSEIRVTKDNFYPVDFTCRAASPCGESLQELFSNMGEVVEAGAHGVVVEPKPVGKYAVQAMISSPEATESWLPIRIDPEIRQCFKMYHSCLIRGKEGIVPTGIDMAEIGSVVAVGDTLDQAIKRCEEYAKEIKGDKVKVHTEELEIAKAELRKAA